MTPQLKKFTILLLILWLGAGTASLGWNIYHERQQQNTLALQTAHVLLRQILNTGTWFSLHKEVYVPAGENAAPPHASTSPREHTTAPDSGERLTRIAPAAMLRELSRISADSGGARFRITSLRPIHPENAPLPWEKPWLQRLEKNPVEYSETVTEQGEPLFRFMAPLRMERQCIGCHVEKNYSVGDLRGAITITLPLPNTVINTPLLLSHLGPMLAGSLLIVLFSIRLSDRETELLESNRQLNREIHERQETERELQTARDLLEKRVAERTAELRRTNRQLNEKIHQRAHIEEALTTIYDEFYQLFNSAPDGMLVIDKNFDIMRANRTFLELCGQPMNRIIGRKCHEVFSGSTCRTHSCPIRAIFTGEKRIEIECEKTIPASGKNIPCIVTSTPFLEADGSLIGAILIVTDISRRKQAEMELEESTRRLKESNHALEDFAYSISHDLQEPLMLIEGFSKRLRKKGGDGLSEQCGMYVEQIHTAAKRMRELINGLLLYSRVSNRETSFCPVDLNTVVAEVLEMLALQIEQSGSEIHVDPLPVLHGDPLQVRQLFQNIIGNSIKYRRQDTPHTVHIEYLGLEYKGESTALARIRIRDNGLGFRPEDGEHIFDIFERLQRDRDIAGTGMGLAICKKIVQRHHGSIHATGLPDKGARFTLLLPVAPSTEPPSRNI